MALGISEAVELSRTVAELVKKGITIDLQERIMQLREAVLNAKDEVIGLREENQDLKDKLQKKSSLYWDGCVYWLIEEGDEKDGPYCPRCQDRDSVLIRLHASRREYFGDFWVCRDCSKEFDVKPDFRPADG